MWFVVQVKLCQLCFLLLLITDSSSVFAQNSNCITTPIIGISQLTDRVESACSLIDQIAAAILKLDDAGNQAIEDKITQAKSFLKAAETSLETVQRYDLQSDNASQLVTSLQQDITSQNSDDLDSIRSRSIDDLKSGLSQLRSNLMPNTGNLLSLTAEPSRRQKRLASISDEIAAVQTEFQNTQANKGSSATTRFFVATLDYRYRITHEINTLVYRTLLDAGIAIPYPQQDLHFQLHRSMKEWTVKSTQESS